MKIYLTGHYFKSIVSDVTFKTENRSIYKQNAMLISHKYFKIYRSRFVFSNMKAKNASVDVWNGY